MQPSLPDIDVTGIKDKDLAQQITQILNAFEWQAQENKKLREALEQANQEIARLKGQPKKPHFNANKNPQ